mmetsp:Transcript_29995/g.80216  ORF Transcript_29995/g.80216 Transcript_29995/m.80216 type:complete len:93 (-) Transcript_29995:203-481(-)
MSASAYAARARATRCCCPPESVIPFSPISVASPRKPAGLPRASCLKSSESAQAATTRSYLLVSSWVGGEASSCPKRMLARMEEFWAHAFWGV